jgi:hypothetical protein
LSANQALLAGVLETGAPELVISTILQSVAGFLSLSLVFSLLSSLANTFVGGTYLLVLGEIFCMPGQRLIAASVLLLAPQFAFSYYLATYTTIVGTTWHWRCWPMEAFEKPDRQGRFHHVDA